MKCSIVMTSSSSELTAWLAELDGGLCPRDIAEKHPEFCERDAVLGVADEVNRLAREDLSRAERLADVVVWLADLINDDFCRARASRCVGNMKVLRGKHSDALNEFSRALALFRKVGASIEEAATLSGSLQPLIYQGNYTEALQRAEKAKEIATRQGDRRLLARLEINFGNILHRQDRFKEAVDCYQEGLAKLTSLGETRDCAIGLINLAVCHISLNDFRRAEQAYTSAREVAERENMPTIVAQADYNIAYLHYHRNEYTKAIELYQKTRLYCEKVNDSYHVALCDLDQSEMFLELHLHEEGMQLGERAIGAFENMGMRYEGTKALIWLGIGAYQNRKPFQALEIFAKAQERMKLEANSSWTATLDLYQGLVLQQEGRYYEAMRYCRRAQESFEKSSRPLRAMDTVLLRARLHLDLGEKSEAAIWVKAATATAESLRLPVHLKRACLLSGLLAEAELSIPQACSAYREALRHQDAIPMRYHVGGPKIPYSKNPSELYEAIVSLEMTGRQPDPEAIFEVIEKAKSREIAELISFRANSLPTPSRSKSALVEQLKSLREELNWYYRAATIVTHTPQISGPGEEELRTHIRHQENSLLKTLGELRTTEEEFHSVQSSSTIPIHKVREQLSDDEVILEFFNARGLTYACLLSHDDLCILPLARVGAVCDQLRQLQILFSNTAANDLRTGRTDESQLGRILASLEALHLSLIEPLRDRVEGRRLIIVPDGPLHYVPFQALFDGTHFLSERHALSYAGSASSHYLSCTRAVCPGTEDFVLGEVAASDRTYPGVDGLENVCSTFATLSNLESLQTHNKGSRFVLLKCTLRARADNPVFSSLFLGRTQISILDVFHLHIPCDVLGLAGSGPGIHADGYGKELLTLARGLEYAGAGALLTPLWNSHHHPTGLLLERFYERAASEADRAVAFQKTMAEVREYYPNPFHWAAFTFRGRTRKSDLKNVEGSDIPLVRGVRGSSPFNSEKASLLGRGS
jgi:tetratricopeptide (TPR) repeat protein